jgi:hypothetical protein
MVGKYVINFIHDKNGTEQFLEKTLARTGE